MPRPRTPTPLLEATGALKHDPKRYADRANEPRPTEPLGKAPNHLSPAQKKVWKELAAIAPAGVLTNADRWIVETTVILMTKIRSGSFTSTDTGQLRQCLASLGLTPADRSRVSVEPTKNTEPDDPWSNIIQ